MARNNTVIRIKGILTYGSTLHIEIINLQKHVDLLIMYLLSHRVASFIPKHCTNMHAHKNTNSVTESHPKTSYKCLCMPIRILINQFQFIETSLVNEVVEIYL